MPKNAKPSGSSKVLKNGNSQRDVPEPAEKAPLTQKQLLFGVSFTGKTPITLLTEYCQKRGWHKPDIQSKQLAGSKAYTGIVHIKKPNAKDASAVETVVFKAPEDSDVKIERSSGPLRNASRFAY
jgi:ATP-dependent RNA helicase DHX57